MQIYGKVLNDSEEKENTVPFSRSKLAELEDDQMYLVNLKDLEAAIDEIVNETLKALSI